MKHSIIFSITTLFFLNCANAQIQEKQICHVDPDISNYNYAGLWEKFEDGWICNYWQFFDESEYEEIEILDSTDKKEENDNNEESGDDEIE